LRSYNWWDEHHTDGYDKYPDHCPEY